MQRYLERGPGLGLPGAGRAGALGRVLRRRRDAAAAGADFRVGGRRSGLFAHDFRQVPVDALLELVTERALTQDVTPSPSTVEPPLSMLSQTEFDDSVRQALRDLQQLPCWYAIR